MPYDPNRWEDVGSYPRAGITFVPWNEWGREVPSEEPRDDDLERIKRERQAYLDILIKEELLKKEKYAAYTESEEAIARAQDTLAESYKATGDTPPVDLSREPTTEERAMPRGQRPTMYNRETGQWEEVDPKYSDLGLSVPLGEPRSGGGDPRSEEGGVIFDSAPWQDRGAQIKNNPKLYASNEPGVPAGYGSRWEEVPAGYGSRWEEVGSAPSSWREDIMSELDRDPATRRLTYQMLDTEGGGARTMEALVNRVGMIRQRIPDYSIKEELHSGFYGPINRGYAQTRRLSSGAIGRYQQDIDEVRSGSNHILGRTDQGSRNDPNVYGPGRVPGTGGEVYNYWTGRRRGVNFSHGDSARFAQEVLAGGPRFADTSSDSAMQAILQGRESRWEEVPNEQDSRWEDVTPPEEKPAGTMEIGPKPTPVSEGPTKEAAAELKQQDHVKNRAELSGAISKLEQQGYKVPHFIGTPGEPEGDRAPTMDMENLVGALAKQAQDLTKAGRDKEAAEITKQIGYWKDKIATEGMSAKQWKDQTGEDDPTHTKREVGSIESGYNAAKSSSLGLSEFVSRHGIAPFVHGVRQAIDAIDGDKVAPQGLSDLVTGEQKGNKGIASRLREFIDQADDAFWKRFVSDVSKQREDLAFDPKTEVRTFAGQKGKAAEFVNEVSEAVGGLVPDIGAALVTGGAAAAPRSLMGRLGHAAGIFTLPAARNGMDAAKKVEKNGGSVADQAKAFVRAMVETQAVAMIPMSVESKAATMLGRVAGRTAKALPLASATVEGVRDVRNLISPMTGDEYEPFDLAQNIKQSIPLAILGGVMGRDTSTPKSTFEKLYGFHEDRLPRILEIKAQLDKEGVTEITAEEVQKRWSQPIPGVKAEPQTAPAEEKSGIYRTEENTPRHPDDKLVGTQSVEVGGKTKNTYTWISSEKTAAARLDKMAQRMGDEGMGHDILENMIAEDVSPQAVIQKFWNETYPNLPDNVQKKFQGMIHRMTGFKPGDAYATQKNPDGTRTELIAKNWGDLYPAEDAPAKAHHLTGEDRGLVVLMELANQGLGQLKEAQTAPETGTLIYLQGKQGAAEPAKPAPPEPAKPAPPEPAKPAPPEKPDARIGEIASPRAVKGVVMGKAEAKRIAKFLNNPAHPSGQPLGIVANTAAARAAAIRQARAGLPRRPRINPLHVNPRRFYEGAADVLERGGFKDLARRVRDWADHRAELTARWDNPFRLWTKGASKAEQKLADEQSRAYWEALDKNDLPRAQALYNAAHPKTREFIDIAKRVFNDISNETQRSGLKVFDPIRKVWRSIRRVSNFVPRRVKPEWLKILGDPHKYPLEYQALLREMVAKGYARDAASAAKHLDRVMEEHLGAGEISGIERARYSQLPSHMYDYGIDTVRRYVVATARELARIKAFGQSQGGKKKTAFDHAQRGVDDYSSSYIKALEDVIYDKPEDYSGIARAGRSFSTFSALGNFLSSMRNLFSGVMFNLQHHGIRSGIKSLLDARSTSKNIDEAYELGILHDDLANMMTSDVADAGKWLNKFTNKVLKWNLYRAVEDYTRSLSMVGARAKLREAIREAQRDPTSKQALRNAAQFQRLGIDPQKLLDENGSGPLTNRFLRSDVAEVQGGYTVAQTPVGMNKEVGKTLFHLQKWGTQALRHFDHNVLTPALRAIKLARKERVNVRDASGNMVNMEVPGDLKPLVRYMLLLPAFGLAQKEAQSWIFGTPDREASFAEILMRMDDDALDAFGMLAHKLFMASLNVGLLGIIGNYAQAIQARGLEGAAAPAPIQILGNVKDLWLKAYDQGKLTGDDIRKFITDQFSGARVTTGALAQVGPLREQVPYLQEAKLRQDMSWFRSVMRRFEDDEKIVRPPPIRGEVGKGPLAAVYEDIKNRLFLGDAEGARALIDEHTKDMNSAEKKIAMDSLKKSVSASRPVKAGGSNSEAVRKYVLQWAEKKLPPEDVLRIKEIDDNYRKTAIRLELMAPKPVKDLEGEIKVFKMRNALRAGELGND